MANSPLKFFILTGEPGVGKTTLTKKISSLVSGDGFKTIGFYTEEVRKNRTREGFDIVSLEGQRGRLARDLSILNESVKHKVGKYGVLIQEFENIALPCFDKLAENVQQLLVIDEIGKMELFSDPFRARIKEIFNAAIKCVVLATIPARKGDLIVESIRSHSQAKVWTVTKDNRNTIHEVILQEIRSALKNWTCV